MGASFRLSAAVEAGRRGGVVAIVKSDSATVSIVPAAMLSTTTSDPGAVQRAAVRPGRAVVAC
jgi:hypothetical protein